MKDQTFIPLNEFNKTAFDISLVLSTETQLQARLRNLTIKDASELTWRAESFAGAQLRLKLNISHPSLIG